MNTLRSLSAAALVLASLSADACTFSWHNYTDNGIRERIAKLIGSEVTDRYCAAYNKDLEIVVIANAYSTSSMSLGHATVGLRKRGSGEVPAARMSAYRSQDGRHTQAHAMDLASLAAMDALKEVMADLDAYAPGGAARRP